MYFSWCFVICLCQRSNLWMSIKHHGADGAGLGCCGGLYLRDYPVLSVWSIGIDLLGLWLFCALEVCLKTK